jgi:hypothetical protein
MKKSELRQMIREMLKEELHRIGSTTIREGVERSKVQAMSNVVYFIKHDDDKSSRVVIRRDKDNNVKSVLVSRGTAYADSTCYFNSANEADNFIDKIDKTLPADYAALRVVKTWADTNGYFEVDTKFGKCLIRASDYKEELEQHNKSKLKETAPGWQNYEVTYCFDTDSTEIYTDIIGAKSGASEDFIIDRFMESLFDSGYDEDIDGIVEFIDIKPL